MNMADNFVCEFNYKKSILQQGVTLFKCFKYVTVRYKSLSFLERMQHIFSDKKLRCCDLKYSVSGINLNLASVKFEIVIMIVNIYSSI